MASPAAGLWRTHAQTQRFVRQPAPQPGSQHYCVPQPWRGRGRRSASL